jgi:hypothetical protein
VNSIVGRESLIALLKRRIASQPLQLDDMTQQSAALVEQATAASKSMHAKTAVGADPDWQQFR